MKSSATVTAADTNNDPRQPNRFEKKKNIFYSRRTASHVRDAALDTPPGFGTSCTSPASSNRQTGKPFPRDRKRNVRSTARLFRAMWRTQMTTSEKSSFARRHIVGSAGVGLAASVVPAIAQGNRPMVKEELQNPAHKYPKPPYKKQSQPWPGLASRMDPRPDHGETSYKGSGRLAGRKALITGGDPAWVGRPRSPMPERAPTSPSTIFRPRNRTLRKSST
jgi:hypothetical protein